MICLRILLLITLLVMLVACTTEHNYRGVPAPEWSELTSEQRQLVVDQAYNQDFKSIIKKPSKNK